MCTILKWGLGFLQTVSPQISREPSHWFCNQLSGLTFLVSEPRVWEEGNTPPPGHPLFSPLPGMFLSPSLPQMELRRAELAKGLLNAERK